MSKGLEFRKRKAENLPLEELEKYLVEYINICIALDPVNNSRENSQCYIAGIIICYLVESFGKDLINQQIEEFVLNAIKVNSYERIYALEDYLSIKRKRVRGKGECI